MASAVISFDALLLGIIILFNLVYTHCVLVCYGFPFSFPFIFEGITCLVVTTPVHLCDAKVFLYPLIWFCFTLVRWTGPLWGNGRSWSSGIYVRSACSSTATPGPPLESWTSASRQPALRCTCTPSQCNAHQHGLSCQRCFKEGQRSNLWVSNNSVYFLLFTYYFRKHRMLKVEVSCRSKIYISWLTF